MRKVLLSVFLIGIALLGPSAQAKVTVDPNAPGVQRPVTSSDDIDKRLSQKITYDSGYKRLHDVTDDIAVLSGVSTACGKSPKDWRVRDIPVVVCVKDMPLGKLLRAIADATHTRVASEKVGDNPVRHYRVYRRQREEQAIANLLSDRHAVKLAQVRWQWDAMVAYGKSGKEIPGVGKDVMSLAKLIATLGSDAKEKMLSGEAFSFRGSDPARSSTIAGFQQTLWEDREKSSAGKQARDVAAPTAKDTEASVLAIKIIDEGEMGDTQVMWTLSPSPAIGKPGSASCSNLWCACALDGKGLDLPPYPKDPPVAEPKQEIDNPAMVFMARNKPEDWHYPILQAKIDIVKPTDLKNATFADAIRAVAKSSGCNIVAEDFASHMDYSYQNVDSVFAKDTTAADRLRNLWMNGYGVVYNWFFGKDSNLLVGWASFSGFTWVDHHNNLLPERYLSDMKLKLNGQGVQFDDVAGLWDMTMGSLQEWIIHSRDLIRMESARPSLNLGVWRLYDSLSAEDRALARSDGGLPIAKLDPDFTRECLQSGRKAQWPSTGRKENQGDAKALLDDRAMSDPDVIATMTMRVISTPAKRRNVRVKPGFGIDTFAGADIPPALKLSTYLIRVEYMIDGGKQIVDCPVLTPLPLYSSEREAELVKAAEQKAKKADAPTK